MFKQLTALTLVAVVAAACSTEVSSGEDIASNQQEIVSCSAQGLEWKPFIAHLAYDAAEDFGRWEFTTDLAIGPTRDRLVVSQTGLNLCASRGRPGCPSVTAGLSAQEGNADIRNSAGVTIVAPINIRSQLVSGFQAQASNEQNAGSITDPSEATAYRTFRSPTKTGFPHTLTLTNCAVTLWTGANFTGTSQCLRAGNYRLADLKIGGAQASSVQVKGGSKVALYEMDRFAGMSLMLTADAPDLAVSAFDNMTSSLVVSTNDASCSAIDSFKVSLGVGVLPADWHKIRAKLVTLGYMRGNDVLDVRLDLANNTIDVDPFNVDFVPPSQIGGADYGVAVKSPTAETWRSTEDPAPAIFPVGAKCTKKAYGGSSFVAGIVKASGSYRYCFN